MKSFLSHLKLFFQDGTPAPGQVDDRGRITDRAIQNRNRLKFGIGNIMYQSEECGLGPIHTAIIKALGGGAVQLGYMGAAGSVGSLVQWGQNRLQPQGHDVCAAGRSRRRICVDGAAADGA